MKTYVGHRRQVRAAWSISSLIMAPANLAGLLWFLLGHPHYTADQAQIWAAVWLACNLFVPALVWSIMDVVETHREIAAERRERPARERLLNEAYAYIEAQADRARQREVTDE